MSAPDSSSIYREPASPVPLRVWPVRTDYVARLTRWIAVLVAIAGAAIVFAVFRNAINWALPVLMLIGAVPGLLWLMLHAPSDATTRVARGRGEIRLFDDRVEVPPALRDERGRADVFPLAELEVAVAETRVSVNFVVTTHFQVAELRAGALRRRISSRLFESDAAFAAFIHDVQHMRHRLPLQRDDDDYDERLDRELDALD